MSKKLVEIASKIQTSAERLGWKTAEVKLASTGSIYIELVRDEREWVVIRVATHNQVYHRWFTTYSLSPKEYTFSDIIEILARPFGQTGDVLL